MSDKYKVVSGHAEDLADGRIALPDEPVTDVDVSDPHNAYLIEAGVLVKIEDAESVAAAEAQAEAQRKKEEADRKKAEDAKGKAGGSK